MKTGKFPVSKLKSIAAVIFGNFLYALAVQLFLIPSGLVTGGTTGIALTVNHFFGLPVSTFVFIFNIVMLFTGLFVLGRAFALTTLHTGLFSLRNCHFSTPSLSLKNKIFNRFAHSIFQSSPLI